MVSIWVMKPARSSVTVTVSKATSPALLTEPEKIRGWPSALGTEGQSFVTVSLGVVMPWQAAVAVAVTLLPVQRSAPVAANVLM